MASKHGLSLSGAGEALGLSRRMVAYYSNGEKKKIGRLVLARCEAEAKAAGYKSAELMSTLPGVSFYQACGYTSGDPTAFVVGGGVEIEFVPMKKTL